MSRRSDEIRLDQMRALRDAIHQRRPIDEQPSAKPVVSRPISFNDAMIAALVDGRKTQTRRLLRNKAGVSHCLDKRGVCLDVNGQPIDCHLGQPGDELWVRERWAQIDADNSRYLYGTDSLSTQRLRWRPSLHMPRVASRITLSVLHVRAERVQSISEADARNEGFDSRISSTSPREWFRALWDALFPDHEKCWKANPWVWVVEFEMRMNQRQKS